MEIGYVVKRLATNITFNPFIAQKEQFIRSRSAEGDCMSGIERASVGVRFMDWSVPVTDTCMCCISICLFFCQ